MSARSRDHKFGSAGPRNYGAGARGGSDINAEPHHRAYGYDHGQVVETISARGHTTSMGVPGTAAPPGFTNGQPLLREGSHKAATPPYGTSTHVPKHILTAENYHLSVKDRGIAPHNSRHDVRRYRESIARGGNGVPGSELATSSQRTSRKRPSAGGSLAMPAARCRPKIVLMLTKPPPQ